MNRNKDDLTLTFGRVGVAGILGGYLKGFDVAISNFNVAFLSR